MAAIAYHPRFFTPSWMIRLAWTYSLVQFLPTLYFADVKSITFDDNQTVCYCTTVRNNTSPGIAYLISLSMSSFVLPLLTMSILYYKCRKSCLETAAKYLSLIYHQLSHGDLKTFNSNAKTSDSSVAYCGVGIDMLGTICDLLWHFREKSKRIS